jgi:hypothetical protein
MNLVKITRGANASVSCRTGPSISANRGANQSLSGSPKTRCMSMTASNGRAWPSPVPGAG